MTSITKLDLNNQIVGMRHSVSRAKVQTVNKLTRQTRLLRKKEGPEHLRKKNEIKAERLLQEIMTIKKIPQDEVAAFSLTNTKNVSEILADVESSSRLRGLARLSVHKSISPLVDKFHSKFPDWRKNLPPLLIALKQGTKPGRKRKKRKVNKQNGNGTTSNEGISSTSTDNAGSFQIEEDVDGKIHDPLNINGQSLGKKFSGKVFCTKGNSFSVDNAPDISRVSGDEDSEQEVSGDEVSDEEMSGDEVSRQDLSGDETLKREVWDGEVSKREDSEDEVSSQDTSGNEVSNDEVDSSDEVDTGGSASFKSAGKLRQSRTNDLVKNELTASSSKVETVKKSNLTPIEKKLTGKRKFVSFPPEAKVVMKHVDPFFMMKDDRLYETCNPVVESSHHQFDNPAFRKSKFGRNENFKERRFKRDDSKPFKTFNNRFSFNMNNRPNDKRDYKRSFGKDDGRNTSRETRINLEKTGKKPEKVVILHPSWEAKKKQASIVAFSGKKIVF